MKVIIFFSTLMIATLIPGCKKENNSNNDHFEVKKVRNSSQDPNKIGLHLFIKDKTNGAASYFFGDFNTNGTPRNLVGFSTVNQNNDTVQHYIVDSALRVRFIYQTLKSGVKLPLLVKIDYVTNTKVYVSFYQRNWTSNSDQIKGQITVEKTGTNYTTSTFAAFRSSTNSKSSGLNDLFRLSSQNSTQASLFTNFREGFRKLVSGTALTRNMAQAAIGSGIILFGLFGPPLIGVVSAPVVIMAGTLVIADAFLSVPQSALKAVEEDIDAENAIVEEYEEQYSGSNEPLSDVSEIPDVPASIPAEAKNLSTEAPVFVGNLNKSNRVNYGGGFGICQYYVEYSNILLKLDVSASPNVIESATLTAFQQEFKVDPNCAPTAPVIPVNQHVYRATNIDLSASNTITFIGASSNQPKSNATFRINNRSNSSINGELRIARNDGVSPIYLYTVVVNLTLTRL